MFADYKKWRGQTENSPMEDGRMMPYKPFFSLFEEFLSDDPRVHEIAKRRSTTEIKATPILKKHLDYTPGLPRKLHGDTTSIASTSSNCSKSDTELLRLEVG
jgi:uncharacterized NAD-dependent epimerase/dehydratase family protein